MGRPPRKEPALAAARVPPPAPRLRTRPIRLVIGERITLDDVVALCERVRAALQEADADVVVCDVGRVTDPDLGTIGALARIQLTVRRLGCEVRLDDASPALRGLLGLAGLREVVRCAPGGSGFEARRQAEGREEASGVEEEGDPADPPA